jgi:protein-S-isoprenylcysteine O-methyltransferase Ste14
VRGVPAFSPHPAASSTREKRSDSYKLFLCLAPLWKGKVANTYDILTLPQNYKKETLKKWIRLSTGELLGIVAGGYLIQKGHGTPLPLDPPQALVTTGPYRWVRNPQAIAMTLAVLGEIMALKSRRIWLLLPLTIIYLEVLVKPWEERQLLAAHGERYLAYKKAVPKWLPKPAKNAEWQTLLATSQKQIGV